MISFADRLWLAWKVLTGRLTDYRASVDSFSVTLDFTPQEKMSLGQRLQRPPARTKRRAS